jgi:membrane-associated phospholipid phosphatase
MAVTVLLVAIQTHSEFPRWTPIAAFLSLNIMVSTMALGIHWLVDVIAGVLLALISVTVANHYVSWRQHSTATSPSAGRSPARSDSEG